LPQMSTGAPACVCACARVCVCVCVACKSVITLPPFVRVTASSEASSRRRHSCKAVDGLIFSNKAWCAKRDNGPFLITDDVNRVKELIATKNRSSAIAEMAAQCCTSRFPVGEGVAFFNALFLSNLHRRIARIFSGGGSLFLTKI